MTVVGLGQGKARESVYFGSLAGSEADLTGRSRLVHLVP